MVEDLSRFLLDDEKLANETPTWDSKVADIIRFGKGSRRGVLKALAAGIILSQLPQEAQAQGWVNMNFDNAPWYYVEPEFDPLPRRLWSNDSLRLWFPAIPQRGLPTIENHLSNLDRRFERVSGQPGRALANKLPTLDEARKIGRLDFGHCKSLAWAALQRPEPTPHYEQELGEMITREDKIAMLIGLHDGDGWISPTRDDAIRLMLAGEPLMARRMENGQVWDRIVIATNGSRVRLTNYGAAPIEDNVTNILAFYSPVYMNADRVVNEPAGKGSPNEFFVEQKAFILRLSYPGLYDYAPLASFVH
jgi:hypothetical protein